MLQHLKASHSVRNLARHQVLGTIEEFKNSERKQKEKARLSVQKIVKRRQTLAIPVIMHRGGNSEGGSNMSAI